MLLKATLRGIPYKSCFSDSFHSWMSFLITIESGKQLPVTLTISFKFGRLQYSWNKRLLTEWTCKRSGNRVCLRGLQVNSVKLYADGTNLIY